VSILAAIDQHAGAILAMVGSKVGIHPIGASDHREPQAQGVRRRAANFQADVKPLPDDRDPAR